MGWVVRIFFMVLGVLFLSGCETYYKAPVAGESAKIRFTRTNQDKILTIKKYESENCNYGPDGGIVGVVGVVIADPLNVVPANIKEVGNSQNMLGFDPDRDAKSIERVVQANKDFVFVLTTQWTEKNSDNPKLHTRYYCSIGAQFIPEPKAEYEMQYGNNDKDCFIIPSKLSSLTNGAIERKPAPFVRTFKAPKCFQW